MCLPAVAEIVVTNTAPTDPIDVYSVSTDSAAFQPSYVERQTVVPGESVGLTVLFLARAPGPVFGSLVVETSVGGFLVQVQGEGIRNMYKVRPLALKLAVGHTLRPNLEMFNPHDHALKIEEVHTNDGFMHLILPKPAAAAGKKGAVWEIPPRTSARVMGLSLHAKHAGRKSGSEKQYHS